MINFFKKIFLNLIHLPYNYFYLTAKPNFINPIYYLRILRNNRDKKKILTILRGNNFLNNKVTTGCSYIDYKKIADLIISNKFTNVCEFGSGISTILIAFILKLNSKKKIRSKIYSYEENKKYFYNTKKIILKYGLEEYVKLIYSPKKYSYHYNFLGVSYKNFDMNKNYQLFIIDGPSLIRKNGVKPFMQTYTIIILKILKKISLLFWIKETIH